MSQSPTQADDNADEYVNGWLALSQILSAGGSLSGHERNCCFLNTGERRFADISAISGLDFDDDGRAIGIVDWDQDGRLDLWLVNRTGPRVRWLQNVSDEGHHFVSLSLQGVACNRDAIGAQVAVELATTPPRTITRSLRAGEGFLSQASKRIHVGLGPAPAIRNVRVRWPGGVWEDFEGIEADRHYRLVQGQGNEDALPELRQPQSLPTVSHDGLPAVPAAADRIVLAGRLPLPPLEIFDADDQTSRLDLAAEPWLLNLWSSSCRPCLVELRELAAAEAQLRATGLRVRALCVDQTADRNDRLQLLENMNWPYDLGGLDERGLQLLDILQRIVTSRRVPMPVPTSFLIDRQGQLAVIYRGPVTTEQLLADVAALNADQETIFRGALPFPGRWYQRPAAAGSMLVDLTFEYLNAGFSDVGRSYLQTLTGARQTAGLRESLAIAYLNLGSELARQGRTEEALRDYRQALAANPRLAKAHYGLALLLKAAGNKEDAVSHLRAAVEAQPEYAAAHYQLGLAVVRLGKAREAVAHCETALRLRPDWVEPLNILARIHAAHPDPAIRNPLRAVELATRAAQLTRHQDIATLETLAAAQAAAGHFDRAAEAAQLALDLAIASDQPQRAAAIRSLLEKYRDRGP